MVAFHVFWRPIYRYGIFYGITFLVWYRWLGYVAGMKAMQRFPKLETFLRNHRDDLFLAIILGVLLGGRLGEILIYMPQYYLQHPWEILAVREWGMSFVGGIAGVIIALFVTMRIYNLWWKDMRTLWDIVVCIVPLGSFLWRIGNMLNQELYWRPVSELPWSVAGILDILDLTYVYDQIDMQLRVNTNIIQSALEGLFLGAIILIAFWTYRRIWKWNPWRIGALFLMGYGIMRFIAEWLKDLPSTEQYGMFSISQRIMIALIIIGITLRLLWWSESKGNGNIGRTYNDNL